MTNRPEIVTRTVQQTENTGNRALVVTGLFRCEALGKIVHEAAERTRAVEAERRKQEQIAETHRRREAYRFD